MYFVLLLSHWFRLPGTIKVDPKETSRVRGGGVDHLQHGQNLRDHTKRMYSE